MVMGNTSGNFKYQYKNIVVLYDDNVPLATKILKSQWDSILSKRIQKEVCENW